MTATRGRGPGTSAVISRRIPVRSQDADSKDVLARRSADHAQNPESRKTESDLPATSPTALTGMTSVLTASHVEVTNQAGIHGRVAAVQRLGSNVRIARMPILTRSRARHEPADSVSHAMRLQANAYADAEKKKEARCGQAS